jgi:hypothetical protein
MKIGYQILLYSVAVAVLLSIFALYTRPDFLFTLSNQLWGCF